MALPSVQEIHKTAPAEQPDELAALVARAKQSGIVTPAELDALFDLGYHLKHVDTIFARVFGPA